MSNSPRPAVAGPLPPATPAGPSGPPVRDPRSLDHLMARYDRYAELVGVELRAWLAFHLPRPRRAGSVAGAGRALDAGCGTGVHTELLADRFNEVLAVDMSAPMIDHARARRARGNVRYEVRDLRSVTVGSDGPFDAVLCAYTLHHITDAGSALWQLRSLVRPGGTVLLIDVTDDRRPVPRSWLRAHAWQGFRDDLLRRRRPLGEAVELLRLSLDPDWLDHQHTDRLTPPAEWDALAHTVFPGANIATFGRAHALSWTAPTTGPDRRPDRGPGTGHGGGRGAAALGGWQ